MSTANTDEVKDISTTVLDHQDSELILFRKQLKPAFCSALSFT